MLNLLNYTEAFSCQRAVLASISLISLVVLDQFRQCCQSISCTALWQYVVKYFDVTGLLFTGYSQVDFIPIAPSYSLDSFLFAGEVV